MDDSDLSEVLLQRNNTIEALQRENAEKDAKIQELLSQLDKYKSVLHLSSAAVPAAAQPLVDRKHQRAWGISAEPSASVGISQKPSFGPAVQKVSKDQK